MMGNSKRKCSVPPPNNGCGIIPTCRTLPTMTGAPVSGRASCSTSPKKPQRRRGLPPALLCNGVQFSDPKISV